MNLGFGFTLPLLWMTMCDEKGLRGVSMCCVDPLHRLICPRVTLSLKSNSIKERRAFCNL